MAAGVTLCTFLATFIILGMVLASALVGPQFLEPTAYLTCDQFTAAAVAQGIPTATSLPCPREALRMYKIAQLLGAIAVGCLFFGCILNS